MQSKTCLCLPWLTWKVQLIIARPAGAAAIQLIILLTGWSVLYAQWLKFNFPFLLNNCCKTVTSPPPLWENFPNFLQLLNVWFQIWGVPSSYRLSIFWLKLISYWWYFLFDDKRSNKFIKQLRRLVVSCICLSKIPLQHSLTFFKLLFSSS